MIAYCFTTEYDSDNYQILSDLLTKFPQALISTDSTGKTPLHHAAIHSLRHDKMNENCYELLSEKSPLTVVHQAIHARINLYHLRIIFKDEKKINALTMEDGESGLVPFMLAAECNRDDVFENLSVVYELLLMKPDVMNKYDTSINGDPNSKREWPRFALLLISHIFTKTNVHIYLIIHFCHSP